MVARFKENFSERFESQFDAAQNHWESLRKQRWMKHNMKLSEPLEI